MKEAAITILEQLTAAGETAHIKEQACLKFCLPFAIVSAVSRAKTLNGNAQHAWTYAGFVSLNKNSKHFWASAAGFIMADKKIVRLYDNDGSWQRTWRPFKK